MPDPIAPGKADQEIDAPTFALLQRIVERETGIALADGKRPMLQARLGSRLRSMGMSGFRAFLARLDDPAARSERAALISAITTNVTAFFREAHHFALLRERILPPLIEPLRRGGRLRLWSAACSTGEEAYSIAANLHLACPDIARLDARILATDIDEQVLCRAAEGDYGPRQLAALTPAQRSALFGPPGSTRIREDVRRLVQFLPLNLNGDWPMRGPFHVIFCRNVAIYFPRDRQERLWQRCADLLAPGGWLLLGHSERLTGPAAPAFRCEDITAYRKIG
ncbi:MAG: chemotaxis protein [Rhodobacteraceae bacterium]|nr:chemotaxis protein [Paracoccaceae bacterium]